MLLIETFKLRTRDTTNNESKSVSGEKFPMDHLIVMDDLSGIADNCKKFSDFLTVCGKYRYLCLCLSYNSTRESNLEKDFITN